MSWDIVDDNEPSVSSPASNDVSNTQQAISSGSQGEIRATPLLDQFTSGNLNGFLKRQINETSMNRAIAGTVGGPMMVASAQKDAEEALPFAMGVAGGVLGAYLGHPNLGVGVGTGVGDYGKQLLDKVKGESKDTNAADSLLKGAGAGLLSKGVESVLKVGGMSLNLIPERARVAFYDKVTKAADLGNKALIRNFGRSVNKLMEENPTVRISLKDTVQKISDAVNGVDESIVPQIRTAVKRNPRLAGVLEDPNKAIGLTLKESLELKNAITSTVKPILNRVQKGGVATPAERAVFDVLESFDSNIASKFPQMREVRTVYHMGRQAYNLARPHLNPGEPVENAIMSKPAGLFGLGGSKFMGSTGGKLALKDITGMTPVGEKVFKAAELAHNLNRAADAVGRLAEIGAGGVLVKRLGFGKSDDSNV